MKKMVKTGIKSKIEVYGSKKINPFCVFFMPCKSSTKNQLILSGIQFIFFESSSKHTLLQK